MPSHETWSFKHEFSSHCHQLPLCSIHNLCRSLSEPLSACIAGVPSFFKNPTATQFAQFHGQCHSTFQCPHIFIHFFLRESMDFWNFEFRPHGVHDRTTLLGLPCKPSHFLMGAINWVIDQLTLVHSINPIASISFQAHGSSPSVSHQQWKKQTTEEP